MRDETAEHALERLRASLLPSFDIGGLFSRNEIAHKWKATFRSLLLREAVFYLNQLTASVLENSLDFHAFSDKTGVLLLGSPNKSTDLT